MANFSLTASQKPGSESRIFYCIAVLYKTSNQSIIELINQLFVIVDLLTV